MKRFVAVVPMQVGKNLLTCRYSADNNPRLQTDFDVRFPVSALVNGYVEAGEEVEVLALAEEHNADAQENLVLLTEELREVAARRGAAVRVREISFSSQETVAEHLQTFLRLISAVEDGDQLYACITFGTKPTPIVEMMMLNFCYKTKENVSVECIAYGKVNRIANQPVSNTIYDVTALFFMNEIVSALAQQKQKDPEAVIRQILALGADEE